MFGTFINTEIFMKKTTLRLFALLLALALCLSLASCYDFELPGTSGGASHSGGSKNNKNNKNDKNDKNEEIETLAEVVASGDLQIHFLELGNKYTGDCTYIKAGENDILIDAGSRVSSIETIDEYISNFVSDGKLEYVIVTHAHQDHYAGFATSEKTDSLFDLYE